MTAEGSTLTCVDCGGIAVGDAAGWRAYLIDWRVCLAELRDQDESLKVVAFCPACAELEFDR